MWYYMTIMEDIIIVDEQIPLSEVKNLAQKSYQTMIKGVVDLRREVIAIGGEWHMDANNTLISDGSMQPDCWGFNIVFALPQNEWIEYHSLINIRPAQGNRSQEIQDQKLRDHMKSIINQRIDISA